MIKFTNPPHNRKMLCEIAVGQAFRFVPCTDFFMRVEDASGRCRPFVVNLRTGEIALREDHEEVVRVTMEIAHVTYTDGQ